MNSIATINRTLSDTIDSIETTYSETFECITSTLSERAEALNDDITKRLDDVEQNMPELPKKVFAYNRVSADRFAAQARRNNELVVDAFRPVVKVAETGVRTVVGTTKWAVEQTANTAVTGVRSVFGQAQAQAERTAATLNDRTVDLVDEATDRIADAEKSVERSTLKSMTKAELYQMAQDIDIDGRADMTKAQLVAAINAAG